MPRRTKREWLLNELMNQRAWIEEHGGSLSGYIERYGSSDDESCYGAGGEMIYAADSERLRELERRLARLPRRPRG